MPAEQRRRIVKEWSDSAMKKVLRIILVVVIVLLIVAAVVVWRQWDNVKAVKTALTTSQEDIETMMVENDERIAEAVGKVDGVTVRDLTEEEMEQFQNGELDTEQLIDRLTSGDAAPASGTAAAGSSSSSTAQGSGTQSGTAQTSGTVQTSDTGNAAAAQPSEQPQTEEDANKQQLSRYLAEIYVMKAEYTAWLEEKYNDAMEQYAALDESERTTEAKYSIGMSYMNEALEKEEECDAEMKEIEQKISDLLTAMGEDTSIVDDIQQSYETEKELKKAYYLGQV